MTVSTWDFIQNVFMALGGLGLFLFGLKTMSDGLKNIAGSRMKTLIERASSNKFLAFVFGMLVTAVTQSSTATSIMAIGFVNAGLMKLNQFAGIVIGAGVGTTFTAFLFSFRFDAIAPILIVFGISMHLFFSKVKVKNLGFIILGIGILFFGLSMMRAHLYIFSQMEGFQRALAAFENPLPALLVGLLLTAIIQSSTATIGIIISMYLSGVGLSFPTAAFLVLGANIGTRSTALLSSLAAGTESKRAALIHATYKFIAGTSCAVIILVFPGILTWFQHTWQDGALQVAMFHTLYNLVAAGIMIFFTKQLAAFVYILIPKKQKESTSRQLMHIIENKEQKPEVIFAQSHDEICRMGQIALNNLQLALEAFFERNYEKAAKVMEVEETINYLRTEITAYLTRVKSAALTTEDIEKLGAFLFIAYDIERLGDHAENIAEYAVGEDSHKDNMSDEALNDLDTISKAMMDTITLALKSFENLDGSSLAQVDELEQRVDDLCKKTLDGHIARLNSKKCDPRSSVVFTNMVSDIERCSDHAVNIAARVGK